MKPEALSLLDVEDSLSMIWVMDISMDEDDESWANICLQRNAGICDVGMG